MINLPKSCTIYSTDLIIPAVNSFSSKFPITLWGYQLDPFINKSNPLIPINFKIISSFWCNSLAHMKSNFILNKLPPITDVPIVDFMDTLNHIDNEKKPEAPTVEMVSMTSTATNADIHTKVWQALEKRESTPGHIKIPHQKVWKNYGYPVTTKGSNPHKCPPQGLEHITEH